MKLTDEQLLSVLFNEVADFLDELVEGNLDSYNIMTKARELQKVIQGE
jgi:hypothetical protein